VVKIDHKSGGLQATLTITARLRALIGDENAIAVPPLWNENVEMTSPSEQSYRLCAVGRGNQFISRIDLAGAIESLLWHAQ
jgi:hypothetical protein